MRAVPVALLVASLPLVATLPLVGCAPKHGSGGFTSDGILGDWATEEGGVATFALVGGVPCLAGLVDSDGERFEVRACENGPSGFTWTYHVPSTGFTVAERVVSIDAHALCTAWTNDERGGSSCYTR